jgi:lipoprotein-releasing system ATP-binding protein
MLQAKSISKSFGNVAVLNSVDFVFDKASIISIVGKSGAGKSTLLHILGTLEMPDKGVLLIDNIEVTKLPERELAKFRNEKIGFIFQFHHLLDEFTALENVAMPALIKGDSKIIAEKKAKELLDYFSLDQRYEHKPSQLSGGEQQRVAAARAMINNPSVIFADEPTGNLDIYNAQEMHALFQRMRNDFNQTIVIVTHNQELATLSDAQYKLENGRLIKQE